jgi:hypothetical protein
MHLFANKGEKYVFTVCSKRHFSSTHGMLAADKESKLDMTANEIETMTK